MPGGAENFVRQLRMNSKINSKINPDYFVQGIFKSVKKQVN